MDNAVKMAPAVGLVALCAALGLSRATLYRHKADLADAPPSDELGGRSRVAASGHATEGATAPPTPPAPATDLDAARNGAEPTPLPVAVVAAQPQAAQPARPGKTSPRALGDEERARVLAVLNEERFANLAPAEVYATLLDEGAYLCSERTMYRILDDNRQVRERRNQLRAEIRALLGQ